MKDDFQHSSSCEHCTPGWSQLMHSCCSLFIFFWGGLILTFCIIVFPRILYNETSVNNVTQFHLLATEKLLESLERKQMEYIFSVPVNLRDFPMRNYRSLFFLLYLYSDIWLKAGNKNSRFPWQLLENPGLWAMMAGVVFRSMVILQGLLGTQQLLLIASQSNVSSGALRSQRQAPGCWRKRQMCQRQPTLSFLTKNVEWICG